ncbi:phosphocholine-specific phospholipase C [Nocardia crassostreae]|uniref:phosphocholine-specific phospholipase C n=1 Tax=Nocardia crassostreae TaxID=53428 RepID=UPI00082C6147|nr:phospholipase C, phosphocholine-specific [Nocardia crassostreae]
MARFSRRQVLGTAAAVSAGAAAVTLLPLALHRAMREPMRPGGLEAVEHVILLMQENRSFDHYYGTLRGVRGFGDESPLRLRGGGSVFGQPVSESGGATVLPFSVREAAARAGRPDGDIQYLDSLDNEWRGSTAAWAQGWWDGWIPAKTAATMAYYERRDLPFQYELADTFTVCDAYHCSMHGGTNPNRNYFFTGTTGFEPGGDRRAIDNAAYDGRHPGYDWTTYPERLEAAGISWRIYQEWDNFTDNPVEYFAPFKRIGAKLLAEVDGRYPTTEKLYEALPGTWAWKRRRLLGQLEAARQRLSPAERSLFDRAMYRSEPDTLLRRVAADIAAGTLPRVSWLVPPAKYSEHPSESTPAGSADFIYQLLDLVASDLELCSKTAIFINFDEHDGYFDHVPSPAPPRPVGGAGDDWYDGKAIGLGPRVPMIVVSPWTIGGFVDSEVFDHTSVLRFLEEWTGVREPNISDWRRTVCGDLTSAFDFTAAGAPPILSRPEPVPRQVRRWHPNPPADQELPIQEQGHRPARPLPYQPAVSSALSGSTLTIGLSNTGKSAAHFTIYPFAGEAEFPEHRYVLGAMDVRFPVTGRYDLVVQGPNGFWHELRGASAGPAAAVEIASEATYSDPDLTVSLINHGKVTVTMTVIPRRYSGTHRTVVLTPGTERRLEWPTEQGRYDIEITTPDDPDFRRRLTGRVENERNQQG